MAGATNRSFKAAGIPRKAAAEIRLKAGGRLTLKSALDVAAKHGIDVPQKAHDFAAQRDRKAALKTAKARRAERLTKAIGDASRISRDMRRKAAADAKKVSAGVDGVAKRAKAGGMDAKPRKVSKGVYEATLDGTPVRIYRYRVIENRYGQRSRAPEWKVRSNGRVLAEGEGTMSGAIAVARHKLGFENGGSA